MLMWILTVLAIITGVKGYADGYFPQVCDSMEVQHNSGSTPINPQNSELPYKIEIHPPTGQQIRVTLKADPGHYFRGFMLEARRPNTNAVGTFIVADTSLIRLLTCNNVKGSAVSNHNNRKKDKVEVDWISDGQDQDIFFRATFVETYSVFWRPNDTEVISLTTTPKPSS
ncbi:putative ferric-chelate reductase 1 [Sphaeramia orbicularis]|uniref:putative ferric-chelate reductase 1 n=1 Tax=Sphaeramia orbicularis TaxID=375764 RepID=UPI00117DB0BB|nr:putative ferric-chelate reductase 1 [Sphaeramia orbicularis]